MPLNHPPHSTHRGCGSNHSVKMGGSTKLQTYLLKQAIVTPTKDACMRAVAKGVVGKGITSTTPRQGRVVGSSKASYVADGRAFQTTIYICESMNCHNERKGQVRNVLPASKVVVDPQETTTPLHPTFWTLDSTTLTLVQPSTLTPWPPTLRISAFATVTLTESFTCTPVPRQYPKRMPSKRTLATLSIHKDDTPWLTTSSSLAAAVESVAR